MKGTFVCGIIRLSGSFTVFTIANTSNYAYLLQKAGIEGNIKLQFAFFDHFINELSINNKKSPIDAFQ